LGGHVDFMVTTVPSVLGLIQDGTLKSLAVTGKDRFAGLPDVPTVAESGLPEYSASAWYGLLGPKGLPEDVRTKVADATAETLADPAFIESLRKDGGVPSHLVGQAFADFMVAERTRWGEVVKAADIKVE
jgi:tripartite-type tricarboxylate transporter receptor subunit TctC